MYKFLVFMFCCVMSSISVFALELDYKNPSVYNVKYQNPFIVDENTSFLMEKCDFSDGINPPHYLEKYPSSKNLESYISIVENDFEKARIEFADSSKMFDNRSIAIVSNLKVYYKDINNNIKYKNEVYSGLCKGPVFDHIKRVSKETLKCFSQGYNYISRNKYDNQITIKKHGDFKTTINKDKNGEAYFIIDDTVYILGEKTKESKTHDYFKLCSKPIDMKY